FPPKPPARQHQSQQNARYQACRHRPEGDAQAEPYRVSFFRRQMQQLRHFHVSPDLFPHVLLEDSEPLFLEDGAGCRRLEISDIARAPGIRRTRYPGDRIDYRGMGIFREATEDLDALIDDGI